jgi:S1-C subfamily serine protease
VKPACFSSDVGRWFIALSLVLVIAPAVRGQDLGPDLLLLRGPGAQIGVIARSVLVVEGTSQEVMEGAVIEEVRPNSPGLRAGLRKDDIVINFAGETIRNAAQFLRAVRDTPPGRTVRATIVRNGSRREIVISPES